MRNIRRYIAALIVPLLWALAVPGPARAQPVRLQAPSGELTPENTVIVANEADARFSRDFSALLKQLRVEWVVVDSANVPEPAKDRNVILLGRPDAAFTGEILRTLLTPEEIESVPHGRDGYLVLTRPSPWTDGRSVYVCTGADLLATRNAAEEAVRDIIARAPPASSWIRTRFDAPLGEDLRETVDRLRYSWDDAELPLADLRMDVGAKPRRRVSALEAAEDVERLFYLFSHGYSAYALFNQQGEFAQAKERILAEISAQDTWSTSAFARLLHDELGFVTDCHLNIGDYQYGGHLDFWYDTTIELVPAPEGYQLTLDGSRYILASVNTQKPEPFAFPSLNKEGEAIYRLGTLSRTEPAPLLIRVRGDAGEREFEITLQRSSFDHFSDDVFRADTVGGIPVIRVRGFGDVAEDELRRFVDTGNAHRGEPVVILDVRGNRGGNETWPVQWIQALTGRRAESVLIVSELRSKTTMAGRANMFAHYYDLYPDIDRFRQDAEWTALAAEAYEQGTRAPGWTQPRYPQNALIPNDTTVIIVMNGLVASAGEGLLMRASQAENVLLVGENSMGALTFGNISIHLLPHSRLAVKMPINLNLFPDSRFREAQGIAPDLWVPAADAVNYAVAAVRRGTIPTYLPLPAATLEARFVPENRWLEVLGRDWPVTAGIVAVACLAAYFNRRKPLLLAIMGVVWIVIGSLWMVQNRQTGPGFLLSGAGWVVWGGIHVILARKPSREAVD